MCVDFHETAIAEWLVGHGADPHVRASLRKELRGVADETLHEYRDATPLEWGEQFHDEDWVNPDAMRLATDAVGTTESRRRARRSAVSFVRAARSPSLEEQTPWHRRRAE